MFINNLEAEQANYMTLHEAIIILLDEKGSEMTTSSIADELNKRKLYAKKDGSLIIPYQIVGRASQYPKYFTLNGSKVGLVKWIIK